MEGHETPRSIKHVGKSRSNPNYKAHMTEHISYRFISNTDDPWGCEVNLKKIPGKWKIKRVKKKSQADRHGVRKGDLIYSVDNVIPNEGNIDSVRQKLKKGIPCLITFSRIRDQRRPIFAIRDYLEVLRKNSQWQPCFIKDVDTKKDRYTAEWYVMNELCLKEIPFASASQYLRRPLREKKVTFQPPPPRLGLLFSGNTITKVLSESQAEQQGVCVGWIINEVNGVKQTDDCSAIDKALEITQVVSETTILFSIIPVFDWSPRMQKKKS